MSTKEEKAAAKAAKEAEKVAKVQAKADAKAAKEQAKVDAKAAKEAEKAAKKAAKEGDKLPSDIPAENTPAEESEPNLADPASLKTGVVFEGHKITAILAQGETDTHFLCSADDGCTYHVPKSLFE